MEASRGKALADEFKMRFFETSAKDGTNVRDAFYSLARDVLSKMLLAAGGDVSGAAAIAAGDVTGKKGEKCLIA